MLLIYSNQTKTKPLTPTPTPSMPEFLLRTPVNQSFSNLNPNLQQ